MPAKKKEVNGAALNACRSDFAMMFNHVSDGIAIYDVVDGCYFVFADINKSVERIEHVKRKAVLGKRVEAVFPGVSEFGILDIFKAVYKDGRPRVLPLRMYADKRIKGWRKNYVFKNANNQIVAVYSDLTSLKFSEKELSDRVVLQDLLVRSAQKFSEGKLPRCALHNVISDLGKVSDSDRVTLFKVDKKNKKVNNFYEWSARGVFLRASVKELRSLPISEYRFILGKVAKKPFLFISDVSSSKVFNQHERLALLQQRISAYLVIPLKHHGSLEGLLVLENFNVGLAWDKGLCEMVAALGNVICLGMHCFA